MSRNQVIESVCAFFDEGHFLSTLKRRVAMRTESQKPDSGPLLHAYLREEIVPLLQSLGFTCQVLDNPVPGRSPFLLAERIEPGAAFSLLTYGHGDVVSGYDAQWREGLNPWDIVVDGDRMYGRGTADNKGQHTVNLVALEHVLRQRDGKLGYNVKLILEMGEETGSPGLDQLCRAHRDLLQADLFIASDGPRVSASRPTMFLGARGGVNFDFHARAREGAHHSGNWGGLLRNPGTRLANAIASMVSEDGRTLVEGLLPRSLPENVRHALRSVQVGSDPGDPEIDPDWGEPGLTPAERVFAWNTLEVLAFKTGNPDAPVSAIPASAYAQLQIRFVVDSDSANFEAALRAHLDARGYTDIAIAQNGGKAEATRLDPDDPWVQWGLASMERTTRKTPTLLPNLGGTLPNDVFAYTLGLPTLWVPHSYPGCSQHAPNEHMLQSVARESLQIMAGLFWDLAEQGAAVMAQRRERAAAAA